MACFWISFIEFVAVDQLKVHKEYLQNPILKILITNQLLKVNLGLKKPKKCAKKVFFVRPFALLL